jgi:hypothetical protein
VTPQSIPEFPRRNLPVYNAPESSVENVECGSIYQRGILLLVWNVYIRDNGLYKERGIAGQ